MVYAAMRVFGSAPSGPVNVLVDNLGDAYTIDAEVFAATYREVSPGVYVKSTPIWAEVATEPGRIQALDIVGDVERIVQIFERLGAKESCSKALVDGRIENRHHRCPAVDPPEGDYPVIFGRSLAVGPCLVWLGVAVEVGADVAPVQNRATVARGKAALKIQQRLANLRDRRHL